MKSKYLIHVIALLLLVDCVSCNKFVDIAPPKTLLPVTEVFNTDASATAAILGIYSQMANSPSSIGDGAMTFYPCTSADELTKFTNSAEEGQFQNNNLSAQNSINAGIWTYTYKLIGQANSCIAGLTQSTTLTPEVKTQLLGEAKISRALFYFYLVNLYGDLPLVLTTDYNQTEAAGRMPSAQVYAQIITDLKDGASQTSADYPTTGRVRPNKYAALGLLARVYLYIKDYANADAIASQIINSGVYGPLPDVDDVFTGSSTEAIWQLQPNPALNFTLEGQIFIPSDPTVPPNYYLTPTLLNAFEPGDKRSTHWIDTVTYAGKFYSYPFKYKNQNNGSGFNDFYTILRLSEIYLIRAEARAQNSELPGAIADINVIRDRARDISSGIPNPLPAISSSLNQAAVLLAVQKENRTEFFAEFGHRWFDLKRTGAANSVLPGIKPQWTTNAQLYPIPQSERLLDKNLTQNPGY